MIIASIKNKMPIPGLKKTGVYDSDPVATSTPKVKQPSRVAMMGSILTKALKNKSIKR